MNESVSAVIVSLMMFTFFGALILSNVAASTPDPSEVIEASGDSVPVQDPQRVADGQPLYQKHCVECHGPDMTGTAVGPSLLSAIYSPEYLSDDDFRASPVDGTRAQYWNFVDMQPILTLDPDDTELILAYVRENQRLRGFATYPPGF